MYEIFHSRSATAYNFMDVNPAYTSPVKILVLEGMDIEKYKCGDVI